MLLLAAVERVIQFHRFRPSIVHFRDIFYLNFVYHCVYHVFVL